MNPVTPLVYSTPSEYLKAVRLQNQAKKRPLPLQRWARRLGYKTSRSLELVLSGQRIPSLDMAEKLGADLKFSAREKKYFELMLRREKLLRQRKSVLEVEKQMDGLRPDSQQIQYIDNEVFKRVSEWYPLVIRQLTMTPQFKSDLEWIRKKLKDKVTSSQIATALAEWEGLALDRRSLSTSPDVPSHATRTFHKKMLLKAIEAVDEIDVSQREFISHTFKSSPEKIKQMKQLLRDFRDQVTAVLDQDDGNEVFQLHIALFPHTNLK